MAIMASKGCCREEGLEGVEEERVRSVVEEDNKSPAPREDEVVLCTWEAE